MTATHSSSDSTVYIGIINKKTKITEIFPAHAYQQAAYVKFMSATPPLISENFNYNEEYIFEIKKYIPPTGSADNDSRLCELVNANRETHILSDDLEELKGFVGRRNRITLFGGKKYSKRRSKRRSKSKSKRRSKSKSKSRN